MVFKAFTMRASSTVLVLKWECNILADCTSYKYIVIVIEILLSVIAKSL